ncbi:MULTISPECIES: site-specific DNA-methyltransferase [Pseudomonadota]|uniref:site-specific DNA-methyltransferase n=1 Tax=Pseudomonadota TaxID=1224 RepID=UPI0004220B7A|nr:MULTISPECIES: site-specific DNA-methyltransferase [Pseudomonadota]MCR3842921.1 site-specific DNA-methyltransferase [Pseudomonas aeruginosa]MDI4210021.1 site-specific DNA-methyltransferase [Pseudomonas aeruginosa]HBP0596762.1 site-specific DNA-methyltransferase [Pseudomonas aeruginosa]
MNKKLELTWIGKERKPKLEPRILIEDQSKSHHATMRFANTDIFDNRLIFGDNLLALKALVQEFSGQVKCVFIDPPYNTGSAFTHYDDGLEHSIWLGLMRDRLELIKQLLSDDGSLWITIDDNEGHYLKVLCDEIFGRNNFISTVIWQKKYAPKSDSKYFSVSHDFVLVIAKDLTKFNLGRLAKTEKQTGRYVNRDNDPRGPWKASDVLRNEARDYAIFPVKLPSGREVYPPSGTSWRYTKEKFAELIADNRIWFGVDGNARPAYKRFLSEVSDTIPSTTIWTYDEVGHNDESKKEMRALFGENLFDTPKPERLLERVLSLATRPGDLVLDSFAGSGTTGAVAHKMGRRWIMVELGEHCHTHIIPRLKKVIDGEDKGGISESVGWKGGGGFRYYRLAPSLIINDRWGNPVINPEFNAAMLAEALAKLEGFNYAPSETHWWQHGHSSERDFIYVTTQNLSAEQLQVLSDEVGAEQSLLVCCAAFHGVTAASAAERWPNLTLKKIPKMVLARCHWGRDDYSLNVSNLPMAEVERAEPVAPGNIAKNTKSRKAALANAGQGGLFGENE